MKESRSFDVSVHGWRGFGLDREPDLFFWRRRFGVVTVTVSRVEVLAAYQGLKAEVAKLRATIAAAVDIANRRNREDREGR